MQHIKLILFIVLIVVLGVSGMYVYSQRSSAQAFTQKVQGFFAPVTNAVSRVLNTMPVARSFTEGMTKQIAMLSFRGQTVGSVLGSVVQVNEEAEEGQTAADRLLERGKYLYCKQVVSEYEKKMSTEK